MQYALLMRANKPETAVHSSAPFSLGTKWIISHDTMPEILLYNSKVGVL